MPRRHHQRLVESTSPSELSTNSIEYSSDLETTSATSSRPGNPVPMISSMEELEEFTPPKLTSIPGTGLCRPRPKRATPNEPDVALESSDFDDLASEQVSYFENQSLKILPPLPEKTVALVCHHNQLKELCCNARLQKIWANLNRLTRLTGTFQNLRFLEISDNQLTSLPIMPALEMLVCEFNQLKELFCHAQLQMVWANGNRLTLLTGTYQNLRFLEISDNRLTSLPSMPVLETLICEYNQLTEIPAMPNLTDLYVSNNRIQYIGYCPKLEFADVRKNRLHAFTPGYTPTLRILWAQDNPLIGLQAETFPNLYSCNVSRCQIKHFLGEWPNLAFLYCSHNRLTHLEGAQRLLLLDCSHNRLTQLPPGFPEMVELRCSYNPLTHLPAAPGLEILYADHLDSPIIPFYPNLLIFEN